MNRSVCHPLQGSNKERFHLRVHNESHALWRLACVATCEVVWQVLWTDFPRFHMLVGFLPTSWRVHRYDNNTTRLSVFTTSFLYAFVTCMSFHLRATWILIKETCWTSLDMFYSTLERHVLIDFSEGHLQQIADSRQQDDTRNTSLFSSGKCIITRPPIAQNSNSTVMDIRMFLWTNLLTTKLTNLKLCKLNSRHARLNFSVTCPSFMRTSFIGDI